MFRKLSQDLRTVVVAVVTASVVAGPTAVAAAYVVNADKVDNKHAVAAGAAVDVRKGKLVATRRTTGRLPNDIIAKAPDANMLDGKDSAAFVRGVQVRAAVVSAGGTLVRGIGVTGVRWTRNGLYEVTFDRDVSKCTYVATPVTNGPLGEDPAAHVEVSDHEWYAYTTTSGLTKPNGLFVMTRSAAGELTLDESFHLVVYC